MFEGWLSELVAHNQWSAKNSPAANKKDSQVYQPTQNSAGTANQGLLHVALPAVPRGCGARRCGAVPGVCVYSKGRFHSHWSGVTLKKTNRVEGDGTSHLN